MAKPYELWICFLYWLQITQLYSVGPVWVCSSRGFTCFIIRLYVELFWYILQLICYPLGPNFVTDLFSAVWGTWNVLQIVLSIAFVTFKAKLQMPLVDPGLFRFSGCKNWAYSRMVTSDGKFCCKYITDLT